jgi:hypothetical protein
LVSKYHLLPSLHKWRWFISNNSLLFTKNCFWVSLCLYVKRNVSYFIMKFYSVFIFWSTRILFCLTTYITYLSNDFAQWQAACSSMLLKFAESCGPRILVQCVAVNIRILPTIFQWGKEGREWSGWEIQNTQRVILM